MNINDIKKLCSTVALAFATCTLSAGIASAQTLQRVNLDRINPQLLRADDFTAVRISNPRPILDDVAWPAAAAAVAAVVKVATVVAHHVTESFLPNPVTLPARGNLVSLGLYDR